MTTPDTDRPQPDETQGGKHDTHEGVWEQIVGGAAFDAPYAIMNVLATVVACYGLLENSAAVVIGAMLIAMLLGPISGIALALVAGDTALLRRALLAEVCGVLLVLTTSFVLGKIYRDLPLGSQVLSRTAPNILDLIIALAGGTAGAYATITPKLRASLVGIAIATALVPPLSVCGMCLARGETALAWGGFLLFFANFVAIQFAFSVVLGLFGLYRTHPDEKTSRRAALARQGVSITLLVVLAAVLGNSFRQSTAHQREAAGIRAALLKGLTAYPGAQLADLQFERHGGTLTAVAIVRASGAVSPPKVAALQAQLPEVQGKEVTLQVRSVITKTATAQGYVQESKTDDSSVKPSSTDTGPKTVPDPR